jgi:RHS repeat-associated protein
LGYDVLDRLTSAVEGSLTIKWSYDANGNRLTQTYASASTFNISSTSNRITSTTGQLVRTYAYDAAGNPTSYGTSVLAYNDRGRLASDTVGGTASTLVYNALGQMIEYTFGSTSTVLVYDERGHILGEYYTSGVLMREYIWMDDIPVAEIVPSGSSVTVYYIHTDQLNAPRKISLPSTNALAWRWDPHPFAEQTPNQNPSGLGTFINNLRFPGQYYTYESGLNHNGFRDYDPQTGKYLESDPIGLGGGSYSTYAYTRGNPISLRDPLGLWAIGDPLPQVVVNIGEGFGEGAVAALTLNRVSLQDTLELFGAPHGGADMCSRSYQAANAAGALTAGIASLGSSITQATRLGSIRSAGQATMLGVQLLTGSVDVMSSLEEGTSLVEQLTSLEDLAQEALAERGLIVPGRSGGYFRLPPPQ